MHLLKLTMAEMWSLDCRFFLGRSRFVDQMREVVASLEGSESAQCRGRAYVARAFLVLPVHLFHFLLLSVVVGGILCL